MGEGTLAGCRLWDHTQSDTTEVTEQQQREFGGGEIEGRWLICCVICGKVKSKS